MTDRWTPSTWREKPAKHIPSDYPDAGELARVEAELKALLEPIKAWARLHCRPDFGLVENVQEHVLTQEDIDQAMETEA